jgi:hypothetical protein
MVQLFEIKFEKNRKGRDTIYLYFISYSSPCEFIAFSNTNLNRV